MKNKNVLMFSEGLLRRCLDNVETHFALRQRARAIFLYFEDKNAGKKSEACMGR